MFAVDGLDIEVVVILYHQVCRGQNQIICDNQSGAFFAACIFHGDDRSANLIQVVWIKAFIRRLVFNAETIVGIGKSLFSHIAVFNRQDVGCVQRNVNPIIVGNSDVFFNVFDNSAVGIIDFDGSALLIQYQAGCPSVVCETFAIAYRTFGNIAGSVNAAGAVDGAFANAVSGAFLNIAVFYKVSFFIKVSDNVS